LVTEKRTKKERGFLSRPPTRARGLDAFEDIRFARIAPRRVLSRVACRGSTPCTLVRATEFEKYYLFLSFFDTLVLIEEDKRRSHEKEKGAGKDFVSRFFSGPHHSKTVTYRRIISLRVTNRVPNPRGAKRASATRVPPKPVPPRRDVTASKATCTPWVSATARRTSTNTPRSTPRMNSSRTATSTKVTYCTGRPRSPVSSVLVHSPST